MANNYIQPGLHLTVVSPAGGTIAGQMYKVGSIIGVAQTTTNAGENVALSTEEVYEVPKVSAQAWAVGDPLYFVVASRNLTNVTATGHFLVGVATEVALNPSAVGRARLNGTLGIAAQP